MKRVLQNIGFEHNRQGFATLISVLILSIVCLTLTLSIILSGLNSSETTHKFLQMQQARSLAISCSEEALEQLRQDNTYTGSDVLTLGGGTCEYSVLNSGAETRVIQSAGIVDNVVRKVEVQITAINPTIVISSLRDKANFCETEGCDDGFIVHE